MVQELSQVNLGEWRGNLFYIWCCTISSQEMWLSCPFIGFPFDDLQLVGPCVVVMFVTIFFVWKRLEKMSNKISWETIYCRKDDNWSGNKIQTNLSSTADQWLLVISAFNWGLQHNEIQICSLLLYRTKQK